MLNNSIHSLQKRLLAVFVLVAFIFLAIIVRLGYVQLIRGSWLTAKASQQWYRSLPLSAERGVIADCNGNKLALSYSTFDVYVRPNSVQNANEVALILSSKLGLDYDKVYAKIINKKLSEVCIKMQVDEATCNDIISCNLAGVVMSKNNKRYYPYGDLLTQVLGFTTVDNVGQGGLELYYDKYLKGVSGLSLEESDVSGKKIDNTAKKYIPSISGMNLNLTIDVNIQVFLEQALNYLMAEQKPKTCTGIIMNPNTGEIVAMSTKPSYDLNNVPRSDVQALLDTSRNVGVVDVYEPGSTFKVLTMASAVEAGVAHLSDRFYDPGYRIVDGEKIKCWRLSGHGSQTLTEGLCNSCNAVFVDLALRLGKDRMYERFKVYGLGETLGIDFMGESGGILMNKSTAKTVDVARMGFGQAVAVSPLQLITAFSSVVNGGKLMQPYFVKSVKDSNGAIMYEKSPNVIGTTVSTKTSDIMKTMVEQVVKQYSGFNAFIPGYRVGGKTGTTQKYENGRISGKYIASFVGTFPADNPDYVILILADEPSGSSYYGSVVATPYAKQVIENIIKYKNYPADNLEDDLRLVEKNIKIPNVVGMEINKAVYMLQQLGLFVEIEGEGNEVREQFLPAGEMVSKNSIVILTT